MYCLIDNVFIKYPYSKENIIILIHLRKNIIYYFFRTDP